MSDPGCMVIWEWSTTYLLKATGLGLGLGLGFLDGLGIGVEWNYPGFKVGGSENKRGISLGPDGNLCMLSQFCYSVGQSSINISFDASDR